MLYINHLVSFCYLIIAIFFPGNCATCIEGTHTFRSVVQLYITCIYYVWSLRLVKEERPAKMLYDTLISTRPICDVLCYQFCFPLTVGHLPIRPSSHSQDPLQCNCLWYTSVVSTIGQFHTHTNKDHTPQVFKLSTLLYTRYLNSQGTFSIYYSLNI